MFPGAASADALPSPAPTSTPAPHVFSFSGQADTGYTGIASRGGIGFINGQSARVFDTSVNAVSLQNITLAARATTPTLGAGVDLTLGSDADVIASYDTNDTPAGLARKKGWDITQAFVSYTRKGSADAVFAGKLAALPGVESIQASQNDNFSRSILYGYAEPFTETGLRVNVATSSKMTLTFGEVLGWDQIKQNAMNGGATNLRTSEAAVAYVSSPAVSWKVDAYIGKEAASIQAPVLSPLDGLPLVGVRRLYDVVATVKASDALTFAGNYDYGAQGNAPLANAAGIWQGDVGTARWQGVAGYAKYRFAPKWSAAARAEAFRDAGGYRTGIDQKWFEQTFTLRYQVSPSIFFRVEHRTDESNQAAFSPSEGSGPGEKFARTYGAEAVVTF